MDDSKAGYQATPNATLEQQMMDACAPKNEREWWAFVEIGRLRAALENVRLLAARHRKEEWAGHMLRFCADAGVTGSPLREGG